MPFPIPNKLHSLLPANMPQWFFGVFGVIVLVSIFAGVVTEQYFLAGAPAVVLLMYITLVDFRKVFFLLIACIPLSTEILLPNGFGTDLPTEPLIVGLMLVFLLYAVQKGNTISTGFMRHPITWLLAAHVGWILVTSITSAKWGVSLKFSLAKIWYIVVFYFLAGLLIRRREDLKNIFWLFFIPLLITVFYAFGRHALTGFTFKDIHTVLHPFYRNHVSYAVTLALFMPLWWLAISWYRRYSFIWNALLALGLFLLTATYFSYTRAAYAALAIAIGVYFVVKWRLMRLALALALAAGIAVVAFFVYENQYLLYAPNFDKTIAHERFDNLMEATYKMEDISTMERVYRWIAGFYMTGTYPLVGVGPGNFVNFYKSYTVSSFKTYVSDNPEQSGIHSYYLMTMVEQGIPGLIIYLVFCFFVLIKSEEVYHRIADPRHRKIIMAAILCLIVIHAFQLINDLVETDKVGPFFFMYTALIVNADLYWTTDRQRPLSS